MKALRIGVKTVRQSIDSEKIIAEARNLHSMRKARKLADKDLSGIPVHEAQMEDLKNRARLTELRVAVMREIAMLDSLRSKVKKHIQVSYADYLAEWSNQASRNHVVDRFVGKADEVLDDIRSVEEILRAFMDDLDTGSYRMSGSVAVLKMLTERRDQTV